MNENSKRPIIGCTTYRKHVPQTPPIDVYGLMPSYTEAIIAGGGIPLLIPLGLSEEDLAIIFERLDGILLPGGGDVEPGIYHGRTDIPMSGINVERDRTEIFLAQAAISQQKPLFAICRGIQVMNVALGGNLWEDIMHLIPGTINHDLPDDQPRNYLAHSVSIKDNSLLARCLGKTDSRVNSIHHQAIREVAPELVVTAMSEDGIIEAAEIPDHPFAVGVQWHPESLIGDDRAMLSLFQGFVRAAMKNGHH